MITQSNLAVHRSESKALLQKNYLQDQEHGCEWIISSKIYPAGGLEQRLFTLFGLHRLNGISFMDCVRLLLTDFAVLLFSTLVYVLCDKLDQQVGCTRLGQSGSISD